MGYPNGSALELLDGTLKLRYCTNIFATRFPPRSLPWVGNGDGNGQFVTTGHLPDAGSTVGKRVRLTRNKCCFSCQTGSWALNAEEMEKIAPPLPPKERGVRWACLAIFFLALGLGDFAPGDAWNVPSEGTGVGVFPAGQSSRRGQFTGTDPF